MNKMTLKWMGGLAGLALAASAQSADYTTTVNSNRAMAIGFQTVTTPGRNVVTSTSYSINQLHGMIEIFPRAMVGLGFGFDSNFDEMMLGGDFRYFLAKQGPASIYMMLQGNWLRLSFETGAGGSIDFNGFATAALFGFDYAATENLHLNAGYGMQMIFGSVGTYSSNKKMVGMTNNGPLGNFGIHWYF